jgi:hypothetical protein
MDGRWADRRGDRRPHVDAQSAEWRGAQPHRADVALDHPQHDRQTRSAAGGGDAGPGVVDQQAHDLAGGIDADQYRTAFRRVRK